MKRSSLLADGYNLLATVGISSGLGFAYWLLAARMHPPEVFGLAAAIISAIQLVASFGLVNLPATTMRFLPTAGLASRRGLASAYSIGGGLTVVLAGGFAVLATSGLFGTTGASVGSNPLTAVAFVAAAAAWSIFFLQDAALVASGASRLLPVENVLYGLAKLVLLVLLRDQGVLGMVVSWFLPAAVATLPVNLYLFRRRLAARPAPAVESRARPREVRHFLLVGLVGYMATVAVSTAMPLVVSTVTTERQTAFFAAAWTIALVVDLLLAGFPTALLVQGSKAPGDVRRDTRHMLRHYIPLVVAGVIGLAVVGPVGLHFYGADYAAAGEAVLRLFAIGLIFRTARAVLIAIACVERQIGIAVASDVTASGLFILIAALALGRYGIAAAGAAYAAANLVGLAVVWPVVHSARFERNRSPLPEASPPPPSQPIRPHSHAPASRTWPDWQSTITESSSYT